MLPPHRAIKPRRCPPNTWTAPPPARTVGHQLVTSILSTRTWLLALTGSSKSATLTEVHRLLRLCTQPVQAIHHSSKTLKKKSRLDPQATTNFSSVKTDHNGASRLLRGVLQNQGEALSRVPAPQVSRVSSWTRWRSSHLRGQRWTPACPSHGGEAQQRPHLLRRLITSQQPHFNTDLRLNSVIQPGPSFSPLTPAEVALPAPFTLNLMCQKKQLLCCHFMITNGII